MSKRIVVYIATFMVVFFVACAVCKAASERASENPYGVMVHFDRENFYTEAQIEKACSLIEEAGIGWVSTLFNWDMVEPEDDHFDFSRTDKITEIASLHNLDLLVMLGFSSEWASSAPPGSQGRDLLVWPPEDKKEFADYVFSVVNRYKHKIKYWEIWGEENSSYNWRPKASAAAYLRLLEASYKAAKRADPECKVVLGSLAPSTMESYLEQLYKLGARDYFDVVAIDPYTHPLTDYDRYLKKEGSPIELLIEKVERIKKVMARFGDDQKPLWITEIGSPGYDGQDGRWWLPGPTPDKQQQALWLKEVYNVLKDLDLVGKIFWYNFRPPPEEARAPAGLVEGDFTLKPAYFAYKDLIENRRATPQYNVLLITIDSLRPDHMSCYGYPRPTTPNIDALAEEGVIFTQAFAQAPWTSPALISLLTSLYPSVHGVDSRDRSLPEELTTPVEILKERYGYLVPGISYIHTVWNYRNLGFDVVKEPTRWQQRNEEVRLCQWLKANHPSKFFLWHHFYTPHLPYDPEAPFDKFFQEIAKDMPESSQEKIQLIRQEPIIRKGRPSFEKEDIPFIVALYDGEIMEVDVQVKGVVDELKRLGLLDETIIVITADHAEELSEHGLIGHASTTLSATLYDEVVKIPLIIRHPRLWRAGKVVTELVQAIDIMPTIFEMLGVDILEGVQGQSLLPLIEGELKEDEKTAEERFAPSESKPLTGFAFAETSPGGYQSPRLQLAGWLRSIRAEDWKLIHSHLDGKDHYELYNLKQDPEEKVDLRQNNQRLTLRLLARLQEWNLQCQKKRQWLQSQWTAGTEDILLDTEVDLPVILKPEDGSLLSYQKTKGKVVLSWIGKSSLSYMIEYRIGEGDYYMEGSFPTVGNTLSFGPIPQDVWELLKCYNPWRFRVRLQGRKDTFSDWTSFNF